MVDEIKCNHIDSFVDFLKTTKVTSIKVHISNDTNTESPILFVAPEIFHRLQIYLEDKCLTKETK